MEYARQIFGITFGVGIRNRAPNKGENPRSMHHGDIVNYVDVASNGNLTDAQRQQEMTFAQGVDFIFNESLRLLKVRVRYSRVEAHADKVRETLRLTDPLEIRNGRVTEISPGTMFVRQGELVEVVSIDGNNVLISDDNGMHSTITVNEAIQLFDEYIGN
jgi:hypothetical protein